MSAATHGATPYYFVPGPSSRPVMSAIGLFFVILGASQWINGAGWGAWCLAFGMLFPDRVIIPLFPPIPMKARTFVMVFGGLELVLGIFDYGSVAHFAHLGGMVGGYLMIRYWRRQPPFSRRRGR